MAGKTVPDMENFMPMDDEEMISNIKRPSLCSFSSDDSLDDEMITANGNFAQSNRRPKSCTPLKAVIEVERSLSNDSGAGDDYNFKIPSNLSTKRCSLSNILEKQCMYDVNKSSSMLDVSALMSFSSLRRNSYTYSNETLQSNSIATSKSKDSGFQRSTSCTSLYTNSTKRYDHVQSKVKQYIQNIKQSEALRKVQKQIDSNRYQESVGSSSLESPDTSPASTDMPVSKKDLLSKVKELEEELRERDYVIEELEKNHSDLRLKYAEAENKIDDLRIRASQNEEPSRNYISDEKVAELLMSSVKSLKECNDNGIAKHLMKNNHRENAFTHISPVSRSSLDCYRDIQSKEKVPGYSRRSDSYVSRSEILSKSSSCKHFNEPKYEISKSASNVDRVMYRFSEPDYLDIPYEKNSFAKVQQWQRSLVNLHKTPDDRLSTCYSVTDDPDNSSCCRHHQFGGESGDENQLRKSHRYQKNKDADKKRYRKSYPVGCKCEKFKKCRSKEELMGELMVASEAPTSSRRKFRRTVSFASYEDSVTSSVYDDGESSSDSSELKAPQRENYKTFKQRMVQQRYVKQSSATPTWNELKKARSAGNVRVEEPAAMTVASARHKRFVDNVANEYDFPCADGRRHFSKLHTKKYRKLDDCTKVAAKSCHAGQKCKNSLTAISAAAAAAAAAVAHLRRSSTGYEMAAPKGHSRLVHSKSVDNYGRRCVVNDICRQKDAVDCSCLLALENLKLQEHNLLAKYNERARRHSRRFIDKEPLIATYKYDSLEKQ